MRDNNIYTTYNESYKKAVFWLNNEYLKKKRNFKS